MIDDQAGKTVKMKKKLLVSTVICLIICCILAGCGQSTEADTSDKTKEEVISEDKTEEQKEKKNKKESEKKKEFDQTAAEEALKEMSNALSNFLWASMMKETGYNSLTPDDIKLGLSDEEKIRAAVLACKPDNMLDSTFVLGMGGFSEDKTAESGPGGDGFHGVSVSKKDVENKCFDLFGTKASWDDLPIGPVCDLFDAVMYKKGDDSYALIVDREEDTETAFENHECTVSNEDGKYIGKVNMFWGYYGELEQKPGYSNYVASYTLEPDEDSMYGMVITSIDVSRMNNDEYTGDSADLNAADESDKPFYGLWIGSSSQKQESLDLVKDLKDKGLDAYCIYTPEWENLNSDRYWCVTVGRSDSEELAKELIPDVEKAGFNGAYVKYTGARKSNRIYYYLYTPGDAEISPTKVTLKDVNTEALSGTEEDEGPMTLIVDSDTVFDKTCDMQFFPGYKEGESPLDWFNSAGGENLMGVFEVGITGNHVDSFYGSYWWD